MPSFDMPSFDMPGEEIDLVFQIVKRACTDLGYPDEHDARLHLGMDISACHCNGCPLDLAGLLAASPFDFTHDLSGIMQHLDRTTGKLSRFQPRFALACRGA